MAIEMRTERVTPTKAAHYLKRNVDNYRKISRAKAALYAEEMKAGKWQLNGEAIQFDESGKLKNGQHRLAAILIAGKDDPDFGVDMVIMTGVADDVTIYDNGMNRSTKQMAQASGYGDISGTEAAVAAVFVGNFSSKVPKGVVLDWLKDHYAEINRAYRICGANNRRNLASRVGCVLTTYMLLREDTLKSYEIETFFKVFNSGNVVGTDGYEPSPALVARRMFMERYKGMPVDKRSLTEQVEILMTALMDFKKGNKRQLNYKVSEPMRCVAVMDRLRKADGMEKGA